MKAYGLMLCALNRILNSNCRWKPALFSWGAPETEGETQTANRQVLEHKVVLHS